MKAKSILSLIMVMMLAGCTKTEEVNRTPIYETDTLNIVNQHKFDCSDKGYQGFDIVINQCDSKYYSWLTTFDARAVPVVEVALNIQDEKAEQINNHLKERYEFYYQRHLADTYPLHMIDAYYHCFDNICSLIVKDGLPFEREYHIDYGIYNIDIEEGKLLTNDELLKMMNIDKEDAEECLQSEIERLGLIECENPYYDPRPCIYNHDNRPEHVVQHYPAEISERSFLILNDKGKLELLFHIENVGQLDVRPYNGNPITIPNLYPLQLVD